MGEGDTGRVDGTAEVEGIASCVPGVVVGLTDGKVLMLGELLGSADGFKAFASVELSVGAGVSGCLVGIVVRSGPTLGDTVPGISGVLVWLVE